MFLRPVKSAPQCAQSQRKYDAVWLQQEVRRLTPGLLTCLIMPLSSVMLWLGPSTHAGKVIQGDSRLAHELLKANILP